MTIPHYLRYIPEAARILQRPVATLQMLIDHRLLSVIHLEKDVPPFVPLFEAAYAVQLYERRGLDQAKRIVERRRADPDEIDNVEVAYARGVMDCYVAAGEEARAKPDPYQPRGRTRGRPRSGRL